MTSENQKWMVITILAVLFIILASPASYKLTKRLGLKSTTSNGCPTKLGLVLHGVVFALLVRATMESPLPHC